MACSLSKHGFYGTLLYESSMTRHDLKKGRNADFLYKKESCAWGGNLPVAQLDRAVPS